MAGMVGFQLSTTIAWNGNNWMSTVDGNTYVSHMSIPGAHDAATGNGFTGDLSSYGEKYAKTQTLNLTQQWNAGVRAFDLRPALLKNSSKNGNADDYSDLYIWHTIIQTTLTMQSALETLCDLLDDNPTETAIIICRHETDSYKDLSILYNNVVEDAGTKFQAKMNSMFTKNNKIKNHLLTTFRPDLKLDEVRGKIIFLMRDVDLAAGGKVTNWNQERCQFLSTKDNAKINESYRLFCVDYWDTSGDDNNPDSEKVAHKSQNIQRCLQYTMQEHMNDGVWVMNEASGYDTQTSLAGYTFPASAGYASNAQTQNPVVINYLNSSDANCGSTGILWLDYAGVNSVTIKKNTFSSTTYNVRGLELLNKIIDQNAKPGYTSTEYEEYHRALNSIPDGAQRLITTTINGTKYYLTADGYLSSTLGDAGSFTFTYVTGNRNGGWTGWSTPCFGMLINNGNGKYFTNGNNGGVINDSGHLNLTTNSRGGWETQVFYQNSAGKYAVLACNVDDGDSWNVYGHAYWDVKDGTHAGYTDQRNYIWEVELAPTPITITYNIFKDGTQIGTVSVEQFSGSSAQLPVKYRTSTYGLTLSYDISTVDAEHTTVNVTADWDELPFIVSSSYNNATWYYMCANANADYTDNWYLYTNSDNITWGAKQNDDAYKWAFMGNPVTGIQIINKATGASKYLTNTDPGSMTTTQYGWPIVKQTNYQNITGVTPFCFREVDRGQWLNVYAHQAELHYWNGSDQGSTFWVEGAQDITYNIIYNDEIVRSGIGHQSVGETTCVPTNLDVPFATYTYDPTTIAANTTEVTATIQSIDLPFKPSTSYEDAHWYYLRTSPVTWRDSYCYLNGENPGIAFIHHADPVYYWAFIGDPINGFKVVNKAAGANKFLKNDTYFTMDTDAGDINTVFAIEQKESAWQAPDGSKAFGIYYPNITANAYYYTWADISSSGRLRAGGSFNEGTTFWIEDPMEIDIDPYFTNYGQPFLMTQNAISTNLATYEEAATDYTFAQYEQLLGIVNANRIVPTATKPLKVRIKSNYFSGYMWADGTTLKHDATVDNAADIILTEGTGDNVGLYSIKIGDKYVQEVSNPCTLGDTPYYFQFTIDSPTRTIIGKPAEYNQFHQSWYMNANSNGNVVVWKSYDLASSWSLEFMIDVNNDDIIDQADVDAIASILVNKISESWNVGAADVDGDGEVTLKDITTLVNMLLGQ